MWHRVRRWCSIRCPRPPLPEMPIFAPANRPPLPLPLPVTSPGTLPMPIILATTPPFRQRHRRLRLR
ncbi:hypothetical protein C7N43_17720 [Sphingobacteriales bacterium UPWRP_1]|nr:hypothetical protein C7N43_17720 [Sphingobacteriales bacterium UPWRP_1]